VHRNHLRDKCRSPSSSKILPTWRHDFVAFWRWLHTLYNILVFCSATSEVLRSTWSTLRAPQKHIVWHSACSGPSGSFWKDRCGCSEELSRWVMTSEPFYILRMLLLRHLPKCLNDLATSSLQLSYSWLSCFKVLFSQLGSSSNKISNACIRCHIRVVLATVPNPQFGSGSRLEPNWNLYNGFYLSKTPNCTEPVVFQQVPQFCQLWTLAPIKYLSSDCITIWYIRK